MRTTDKNKTSIDAVAIYTDESKIGKSLYIDIDIDGYYIEDLQYSLKKFKQSLKDQGELDFIINYLNN